MGTCSPLYPPAMLFKMLFLSYLYNLSDRDMEDLANLHILVKGFLGLAGDMLAPDHSTLASRKREAVLPFCTAKRSHGFERCRYLGLARYWIQAFFTFMVVNAKRIVKLLTGITFRPQAKGRRAEKVTPVLGAWSWA